MKNTPQPLIVLPTFTLLSIRKVIAVACVLAILAQVLVMAVDFRDEHHHDADIAMHQQMLDVSYVNLPHVMDETSHDCHNSSHGHGSHCHGCAPVFGLSAEIPTVLLDSQHDFFATYSNSLSSYFPANPFRPPIV